MLRILSKSVKVEDRSGPDTDDYDVIEDLSSWEFVNQSDDEELDRYSFNEEDLDYQDEVAVNEDDHPFAPGSPQSSDADAESESAPQIATNPIVIASIVRLTPEYTYRDGYEEDEYEDDEGDDDEYDDELVPRRVSGKLGRQRMMKMGKRAASPRMNTAKSLPYYNNKPGAVFCKVR
ncbi:unnamed protein product [Cuscuta epithymum]|uniref:Uncharacterized protein n=1 Tax=Cuscuta epithymum TaxID=186058 RepID=A0AAV0DQ15_9ASTE|nr:unnamed protein product [Cuscuta epithymum]